MQPALNVLFIVQPHFSLLAFTAAADALTTANLVTGEQRFTFATAALNTPSSVSDLGIIINADQCLSTTACDSADLIIVCGGFRCSLDENKPLSDFLRAADAMHVSLGGLWNGTIALAHAGLMHGYTCALHPNDHHYAKNHCPHTTISQDAFTMDRNRLTAAGPNSSFDLMLLLIQRHDSTETVMAIRNILRADISQPLDVAIKQSSRPTAPLPTKLQRALQMMRNNLDEPVHRNDLATHIGMSTRAMERLFQRHFNTSPARHYKELRLLRAHELLRQSSDPIARIGESCGFVSSAHFSRAFNQRFGCSPKSLRDPVRQLID